MPWPAAWAQSIPALEALLSRAFAVAKRVRSETAIGSSSVSIASVAVQLAEKIFGSLEDKTVYLVGAGKMAELAARHLIAHGARTLLSATGRMSARWNWRKALAASAVPFELLHETADHRRHHPDFHGRAGAAFRCASMASACCKGRRNRPMFFIDIAVPRNVHPDMNKLDGMFVYDVDDLQSVATDNAAERKKEAERAEKIIELEVDRFASRMKSLAVVPTILSLTGIL